ncbi:MAG: hypothetical protein ABIQ30_05305 [Devosia sp.]
MIIKLDRPRLEDFAQAKILRGPRIEIIRLVIEALAILAAIGALFYSGWQTELTRVALEDQRKMSAYQLMGMAGISPATRWQGAIVALRVDTEVSGFDDGCEDLSDAVSDFSGICVWHRDLSLDGSASPDPWSLLRPSLTRELFSGGEMRNLYVAEGKMTSTTLRPSLMEDVVFLLMDMQNLEFAPRSIGKSARQYSVLISRSSLKNSVIRARGLQGLRISKSDISDIQVFGTENLSLDGNWYLEGHPPLRENAPAPSLAAFVCRTPLAMGEAPADGTNCRLLETP